MNVEIFLVNKFLSFFSAQLNIKGQMADRYFYFLSALDIYTYSLSDRRGCKRCTNYGYAKLYCTNRKSPLSSIEKYRIQ